MREENERRAYADPFRRRRLPVLLLVSALVGLAGCKSCAQGSAVSSASARSPSNKPVADRTILPLLSILSSCDVDHRGQVVDMGTDMMRGRVGKLLRPDTIPRSIEHDGATWAVIDDKRTDISFSLAEATRVFASARILPRAAKTVAFYLDEQPLGVMRLAKGVARIVKTELTELPVDAGNHTMTLRFAPSSKEDSLADVDWVRLGIADDGDETYGAPTLADIVDERAVLDKTPHRSIALRAPSAIRCPLRIPKEGLLRASLGVSGVESQSLEVVARADGTQPTKLLTANLQGGDAATWKEVEVPLDAFADQLVDLELRVPSGATSGRVLVGDPEIVVPTIAPPAVTPAQVVVIVVLSGVDRDELPGYSKDQHTNLERLRRLADQGTLFLDHRAVAVGAGPNMASLLTGLPPEIHTLVDSGDALPPEVETMFDIAHHASVSTAFFTAVPQSFKAFGLAHGVEHVVEISPSSGEWKSPIADAAAWIEATLAAHPTTKILAIVHTRGGHPPWSIGQKELDSLPPASYTGNFTPRRAGEQLATIRRHKTREMPQTDSVRVQAMHQVGLVEEDHALGTLLDVLDASPAEDKALVVVTADESSGLRTLFADDPPLDEDTLEVPLYVLFPKRAFAGRPVSGATESIDIARTVLATLDLPPLRYSFGQDLASVASDLPPIALEPRVAESGVRMRARWGSLALLLRPDADPFLCDVQLDPTCAFDRRAVLPLSMTAIARGFVRRQGDLAQVPLPTRSTAQIDDATADALRVWGSLQ